MAGFGRPLAAFRPIVVAGPSMREMRHMVLTSGMSGSVSVAGGGDRDRSADIRE